MTDDEDLSRLARLRTSSKKPSVVPKGFFSQLIRSFDQLFLMIWTSGGFTGAGGVCAEIFIAANRTKSNTIMALTICALLLILKGLFLQAVIIAQVVKVIIPTLHGSLHI